MENSDFYEAERYLKLGLYPQAFEAFMALESGSYECTYLIPCKMALNNQLTPQQLELLFDDLERELKQKNPRAIYNYGLVLDHMGNHAKAIELLQIAMDLDIPEARAALSRIMIKGS